jgi:hypothetical protein
MSTEARHMLGTCLSPLAPCLDRTCNGCSRLGVVVAFEVGIQELILALASSLAACTVADHTLVDRKAVDHMVAVEALFGHTVRIVARMVVACIVVEEADCIGRFQVVKSRLMFHRLCRVVP